MSGLPTEPRFPGIDLGAGHYESFYLKACKPGGGCGLWIRHTVHKRPGAEPSASLWATLFDSEAPAPVATKATVGSESLSKPSDGYIRVGDATLAPGHAKGSLVGPPGASWDLRFEGSEPPFRHLPHGWMYSAPIPRTKLLSPHPNVRYSGTVQVGERSLELDGWPGMVGHNWGAEHAHRWIWMHGANFADRPDDVWFDAGIGKVKLGPVTTPWIGNGVLCLDGVRHRLGGLGGVRSTRINESPTGCDFRLVGEGIEVTGRVAAAEARHAVGWVYADPKGPEHHVANCSIANMELRVSREGGPAQTLAVKGGAAYELGMKETDHGIPLQPYPDG